MSKSRTGRKGRVRLALAGAIQDMETGNGSDNSIVDAAGRLGAASGFRAADADLTNDQIRNHLQKQLHEPGTPNALFQQGEIRGPLSDEVDARVINGTGGSIGSATGGNFAAATGETSAAAIVPLSTSANGQFAHYTLPVPCGEGANAGAAVTAAGANAVTATEVRGICYHPGGPGSSFSALRDMGATNPAQEGATSIILNPSMADIWAIGGAGGEVASPQNIRIEAMGQLLSANNEGAGGDEILIEETDNTAATCAVGFAGARELNADCRGGAGSGGMQVGDQIRITDSAGAVILTIEAQTSAHAGSTMARTGGASGGTCVQGDLFDATTDADENKIYIIAHDHADGAVAYPSAGGNFDGIGGFAANITAAVNAWGTANGGKVTAVQGAGALAGGAGTMGTVTFTNNADRGTDGNTPGGTVAAGPLTVTAYRNGAVLQPVNSPATGSGGGAATLGNGWFCNDGTATANNFRVFANGADGANFGGTPVRIAGAVIGTADNIPLQNFPVRVSYIADRTQKAGLTNGLPDEDCAGFALVWGPV